MYVVTDPLCQSNELDTKFLEKLYGNFWFLSTFQKWSGISAQKKIVLQTQNQAISAIFTW